MEVIEQTESPDRKLYHITNAGRQELIGWLAEPVPMLENRSAPSIQILFAAQLSDEQILGIFERAAEQLRSMHDGCGDSSHQWKH